MFINSATQRRINIYAPFTTEDGTRYGNLTSWAVREQIGVVEIPDPQPPEDYSEETYYRTEQDDAPYVVFTRKSDEQIAAQQKAKAAAELRALELETLMPRALREFMLEQPGAAQKGWYAKVKAVDDKANELRAKL